MRVFHGRKTIVRCVMGCWWEVAWSGLVCGIFGELVVVDGPSNTRIWGSCGPRGTG